MLVTTLRQIHCSLENYQGPLECLYQLVLRREIDIRDVTLRQVIQQFALFLVEPLPQTLEVGAEFVGTLAAMMLLKSRSLLPRIPGLEDIEEEEEQATLEILQHLVEYCRIKTFTKQLRELEDNQGIHHPRGLLPAPSHTAPGSGIEHLTLDDLSSLFDKVLKAAALMKTQIIQDEEWKVSDALILLRKELQLRERLSLEELFPPERCRLGLIVNFLALLEMMKGGEALLVREVEGGQVWINRVQPDVTDER